ncbi:hypothetical protein [Mycobacterium sp. E1747]|uniref:hypothetical protein n=1 Tax=Mycobacterium sp. E1747 TaxID=1834128 RepID=UPI0007FFA155|nr:hypothetical protein [Mycobacterium sp. E1747]OBH08940.1 hypothetical protein A5695_25220 [Mycobacterium sp. E1747]
MSYEKLSDAAAAAVVWSLISDVAAERKDEARKWLAEHMGPEALAAKAIANGSDIGKASWVEGKPKPVVANPVLFTEFVCEHYPDELIRMVNPAFQKQLLTKATVVEGVLIDGNGVPIPGVQIRQSEPYVSVRKSDAAREVVDQLLDGGRLSLDGITQPELEAGGQ